MDSSIYSFGIVAVVIYADCNRRLIVMDRFSSTIVDNVTDNDSRVVVSVPS